MTKVPIPWYPGSAFIAFVQKERNHPQKAEEEEWIL
jgi:hypothetical protein